MLCVGLGVIAAASMITFYESLRVGNSSLVATISASFPAVVIPLSVVFLGESITAMQVVAICTVMAGVFISTLDPKDLKVAKLGLGKGVILAIVTAVLWGIFWTFIKVPVKQIGWVLPNLSVIVSFATVALYMKLRSITLQTSSFKKVPLPLAMSAYLLAFGSLAYNYALTKGASVAIISPISAAYPTLFAVLSFFIFKDPIKRRELVGMSIVLCGIVMLASTSA